MILFKIPTLFYILIVYNFVLIINGNNIEHIDNFILYPFLVLPLPNAELKLSLSNLLIILGILFLFIELLKSTRSNTTSVIEHILSTFVFIVFLTELIIIPGAATGTFLILTLLQLVDVVAGFIISISVARRDLMVSH